MIVVSGRLLYYAVLAVRCWIITDGYSVANYHCLVLPAMPYNSVQPLRLGRKKHEKKRKRPTLTPLEASSASVEAQIPGWPASLKDFVANSFARSESDLSPEEQNLFRSQISKIVDIALKKNMIWMNDWDRQSLPVFDGVAMELVSITDPIGPADYGASAIINAATTNASSLPVSGGYASKQRKKQRLERFNSEEPESPLPTKPMVSYTSEEYFAPVQGTSQQLEKSYFRLTSEPIPSNVRPQQTLERAWKYVLNKYRHGQPYTYFISQFKSIRQDLTVQHIQNDFTIHIYEINARVCLEVKDLGEFNQCQAQLTYLYDHVRKIANRDTFLSQELEFICYRIIYMIILRNYQDVTKLKLLVLTGVYSKLKIAYDDHEKYLEHTHDLFRICDSILLGDYYNLVRLIVQLKSDLPLGFELLDNFLLAKERIKILYVVSKAYRKVNAEYIRGTVLSLEPSQFDEFLQKRGLTHCIVADDFDCVQSRPILLAIVNLPSFNKVDIKGQI